MATKRILLFNGSRLTAYLWRSGQLHTEGEFHPHVDGADGFIAFANYLTQNRTSHFYWLADISEESFLLETIPPVKGRDRNALIARRLKQNFYGTPFTIALSLGRSSEGRRDEKMLLAALTRPEAINAWLEVIRKNDIILAGIYSVPLILAECAPRWLVDKRPTLLINQTASGIHQSFFDQGKLQFSRLTSITPPLNATAIPEYPDNEAIAQAITRESVKTTQYLISQRQLTPNTPMRVAVLISAEQKLAVQSHCQNLDLIQYDFLDLETIAQHEKLKSSPAKLTADQLLMHCLVTKLPALQFAPPSERHFYQLAQIRLALTAVAIITLVSGLLFAIKTALDTSRLEQATSTAQLQTALATQRYNALLDSLPKTSITPENLRALMTRYEILQKRTTDPTPLLTHLSQALDATPQVELVTLDWKVETTLNNALKVGAGDTPQSLPSLPGNASADINPASSGPWAALKIQARLPLGLAADMRKQKALIDTFVQRLQNPQTTVQLLSMPFDIESGKPLKSMQETSDGLSEAVSMFSLIIAQPL
jgi:hypothetical protein